MSCGRLCTTVPTRALDPDERRFDRFDLTAKLYIGLYEYDDENTRGTLQLFDVQDDPPRAGRPTEEMTSDLATLVETMAGLVKTRNSTGIEWATLAEETELDESSD